MTEAQIFETGGVRVQASRQPDGSWIGQVLDRQLPQLTAGSLPELKEQCRSMLAELAANEAADDVPGTVRRDALLQGGISATGPVAVSEGDLGFQPVVPGPDEEDWED